MYSTAKDLDQSGWLYLALSCITPCIPIMMLRTKAREQYDIQGNMSHAKVMFRWFVFQVTRPMMLWWPAVVDSVPSFRQLRRSRSIKDRSCKSWWNFLTILTFTLIIENDQKQIQIRCLLFDCSYLSYLHRLYAISVRKWHHYIQLNPYILVRMGYQMCSTIQ